MTSSGTPRPTEPRLSDVGTVCLPAGIVTTGWPGVRAKLIDFGVRFQRWQAGAARCILAKREDGLYAAGIGGVVISIPRQVGKSFLIGAIIFALCLIHPGIVVLWTAHRTRTSNETFRSMQAFARRKKVAPYIGAVDGGKGVRRGSGEQSIEFKNGSRILFGAREHGFGRGIPGVSIVIFDEAQILTQDAVDDMVPAANQGRNPLIIYAGTPPKDTDPGEHFGRLRQAALDGDPDTLLIQLQPKRKIDPEKVDPSTPEFWQAVEEANPSYPRFTPRAAILRMFKQLGRASFILEGLAQWTNESGPPLLVSKDVWSRREPDGPVPSSGGVAVGIKFSLDGTRVAAAAARKPDGNGPHVEMLGEWPITEGLGVLETLLTAQWRQLGIIVIDGKAGRDVLAPSLLRARIPQRVVILPTVDQVIAANATYLASIEDATLTHANQPGLNASMAAVTKRKIGTAGGWGMAPIGTGDEVPAEAAALAVWGTTKVRKPAAMPRRLY